MTALPLFEVRRAAQRRIVPVALLIFAGAVAVGHYDRWRGSAPANGSELFGPAYLLGVVLLMRFGLAADRNLRFDEYLIANHVKVREYMFAKAAMMAVVLLAFGVIAVLVEVVFSGGDLSGVAWTVVSWTLTAWLLAPFAMAVEASADTSLPAAAVLLLFTIVVIAEYMILRTVHIPEVLGLRQLATGDWGSLEPLALRALIGAPIGFGLVGWLVSLRLRRY